MAQVIGTNVASLNAQRNLNHSQAALQTSLQRLSSGLRINSAKDDAAGLAIAQRFTSQINGLDQAARNANDGISLAQTAEGSLGTITDNLQRIRQLSVQAANATNTSSDRAALQTEVAQLKLEVDRVANNSSFNGVKLLDGSNPSFTFQVGSNTSNNDVIAVTGLQKSTLVGLSTVSTSSTQSVAISGLTTTATAAADFTITSTFAGTPPVAATTDIGALAAVGTVAERAAQVVDAVNKISATTGVNAFIDTATNKINLTSGVAFTLAGTTAGLAATGFAAGAATTSTTSGLTGLDVSSFAGAQLAIQQIDSALGQVSSARATLGAVQNRFSSVVSNLQTTSENLSASRSRIQDADFAAETANLTRAQILQQAGTAMLAQANSLPNNVLSLLKG
ncbi:MAG: flagellin [Pseudomonadota bacterium]|nr:flagellin [Pseudomonadota bacterium]